MSNLISAEYHGTVQLRGHDYDVVICYKYSPDSFYTVVEDCYTHNGIKSVLLKNRVDEYLPIFLEKQARKDFDRLIETARDERIDRRAA